MSAIIEKRKKRGGCELVRLGNDWDLLLRDEFSSEYYLSLREFLKEEYSTRRIYPDMNDIFNAFKYTPYENVKVVILGQDPYHGQGQAHGLCFSVLAGVKKPPSLVNIFKELKTEYGFDEPRTGELVGWAKQGVLLLNTTLTVREASPMSHTGRGWEILTDRIIGLLNERQTPIVFMLWGGHARKKRSLITNKRHLILESAHPSPLSAYNGFFGNRHFISANEFLEKNALSKIDWSQSEDFIP